MSSTISARIAPNAPTSIEPPATSSVSSTPFPPEEPGPGEKSEEKEEFKAAGRIPLWLFIFGSSAVVISLIISTLIHTGLWGIFTFVVLPPERDSHSFELNARLVAMMIEEAPPEPEEKPEEPEPPIIEDSIAEPKEEVIEESEPEPPAPEPPAPVEQLGHGLDGIGEGGIDLGPPSVGGGGFGAGSGGRGTSSNAEAAPAPAPRPARERGGAVRLEDTSVPPKPLVQEPALGYPREFREAGIEGRVVVQCIITERGDVRACRHRSGPEELGRYAISIVRNWKFEPGQDHRGRKVPVAYTFRFPFRLR